MTFQLVFRFLTLNPRLMFGSCLIQIIPFSYTVGLVWEWCLMENLFFEVSLIGIASRKMELRS